MRTVQRVIIKIENTACESVYGIFSLSDRGKVIDNVLSELIVQIQPVRREIKTGVGEGEILNPLSRFV
jgi:hypothetical protein